MWKGFAKSSLKKGVGELMFIIMLVLLCQGLIFMRRYEPRGSDLQTTLIDEYSNEKVPSDGEIYRKVRQYRNDANAHFENRWLARLSDNKARRLRGLDSNPIVRASFDSLLVIPSLVIHGMQIGSLPQALAIDCDEEIVHALTKLLQFWSSLVRHDREKMLKIDRYTVETLQLLAPGVSLKDRTTVKGLLHSGEVFSEFTSSERISIWNEIKKSEGTVPSLFTFFKDLWYLESCANCIKRLITPSKSFPTIKGALRASFSALDATNRQYLIQTSETGFRHYSLSQGDPAELGYRQLWLYAMRHYPSVSKMTQKKDPKARSNREVVDPMILFDMAVLAKTLGFQSPQIEQLVKQSPDRQIARDALLRARRTDRYRYNEEEFDSLIFKVTECFLRATRLDDIPPVQYAGGRETKKESRYGHPQAKEQLQDRQFLFIDQIHGESLSSVKKATSLFVRRSVYFTFFGKLPIPAMDNGDSVGDYPSPDLAMSPLFVPSNVSPEYEPVGNEYGFAEGRTEQHAISEQQLLDNAGREQHQQRGQKELLKNQQQPQRTPQSSSVTQGSRPFSGESWKPSSPGIEVDIVESMDTDSMDVDSTVIDYMDVEMIEHTDLEEHSGPTIESECSLFSDSISNSGEPISVDELVHHESDLEMASDVEGESQEAIIGINCVEMELQGTPLQGETEVRIDQAPQDTNMEEHARVAEDESAASTKGLSPRTAIFNTLKRLEGGGKTNSIQGPSSAMSHQQNIEPPVPSPQDTLVQDISDLLQPTRHTQINFLKAKALPQPRMNEEDTSLPGAEVEDEMAGGPTRRSVSSDTIDLTQIPGSLSARSVILATQEKPKLDHQYRPEESLTSEGIELEIPSEIQSADNGNSSIGNVATWEDMQRQTPETVSEEDSAQGRPMVNAAHEETVTDSPPIFSSQGNLVPKSISTQPNAHKSARVDRPKKLQGGQDGRREQGDMDKSSTEPSGVEIIFRGRDKYGEWSHVIHRMMVDPSDPSSVQRMASKNARKRNITFYDKMLRQVPPAMCFDAAIEDGANTLFMTDRDNVVIDEEAMNSITRALEGENDGDMAIERQQCFNAATEPSTNTIYRENMETNKNSMNPVTLSLEDESDDRATDDRPAKRNQRN
ncbi:hypothetical protein N7466_011141 [Penicillium verhagenii]|uniref:uncharacterized protein n=1 Tax=Penicillium verhagenii TaxID=1562060 RepID=UPI00254517FC|nr:uncharacterized protein N7466_011141 [Penicillium verhagenii]KAJ5917587.1 hypothetical protein N7466_011141 [Penicillium verhagenii]